MCRCWCIFGAIFTIFVPSYVLPLVCPFQYIRHESQKGFWFVDFDWLGNPFSFRSFIHIIQMKLKAFVLVLWLEFWWGHTVLFCLTSVCREPDDRYVCENLIRNPFVSHYRKRWPISAADLKQSGAVSVGTSIWEPLFVGKCHAKLLTWVDLQD